VTGFGQFMGVTDNPTQHLIEALQGKLSTGPDGGAAEDPDGGQVVDEGGREGGRAGGREGRGKGQREKDRWW